jgi:NAD(P)-dependent dehydrogenase (short-subunit alcohol dehydrogenase family)
MAADKSQFQPGHMPENQFQDPPGAQHALDPQPATEMMPTPEGGYTEYLAAGKLRGKRAIITGGDSGIGRATAVLFAMEGADSFIAHLPEEEKDAQDTKKQVESKGARCHLFAVDLTKKENCIETVDKAVEAMGGLDILFNNHAFQMVQDDILSLPDDQWLKTFDTNIHPFFYLSKTALPHLLHNPGGGTIINNASINAYIGRPDLLDYTSTKGAIVSFTRALSNQFVAKKIRVNAIAPGPVWTPLIAATMGKKQQDDFTSPMGRPGQPSEMASVVVFLASQDSSMISGQTIHANGGTVVNG